jgi:hypothetical protein
MATDQAALSLVTAFHEAVNGADEARLLALVTADVEVGGPRGSGSGATPLTDWMTRTGIRLTPGRLFARGSVVVAEEVAAWKDAQTGATSPSQAIASVFRIRDGRIAGVVRYDGLADALRAAGLETKDEVHPGPHAQ